jgi:hypothetical protein
MSEQLQVHVETTITRGGFNYEAAIMSALTAREMAGANQPVPDPDLIAWKMSGGRERGPLARLLPEHDAEAEAEIG